MRAYTIFTLENVKCRGPRGDLAIDGWIILKCILIGCEDVDWIWQNQDLVRWQAVMDTFMNCFMSIKGRTFFLPAM
jgi:hypothetical protein